MVKDLLREIKGRWQQFIALILITTLGVGFFVGIQVTGYDMRKTGDAYMENNLVFDLNLKHTLGIDQQFKEEVEDLINTEVDGIFEDDMFARNEKFDDVLKVFLYDDVSKTDLTLTSGRFPLLKNEVVVDKIMQELYDLKVDDKLKIVKNNIFKSSEVVIVGFVESSLFLNLERGQSKLGVGKVSGFLYGNDLDQVNKDPLYTSLRIKSEDVESVKFQLEKNSEILSKNRFDRLTKPEIEKLEKAQKELDSAKATALAEFEKAHQQIEAGKKQLEAAKSQLEFAMNEIASMTLSGTLEERLAVVKSNYSKGMAIYESVVASLNETIERIPSEEGKAVIYEQLEIAQAELNNFTAQYTSGIAQVEAGIKEYNAGVIELNLNIERLESEEIAAHKKFEEAQKEIDNGYQSILKSEHGSLFVLDRQDSIIGYREFYDDSNRIEKIGKVFPMIFFGVSILITLSTMTRMIDENRMEMGVYKALGYSTFRTSAKYTLFALNAWLIGSLLGLYLGFYFIPVIIYDAYRIMYLTPPLEEGIVLSYAITPMILSFLSMVGISFVKSLRVASEKTASLLRPVAPKNGQRIFLERIKFIWNNLSFLFKVSFRNLFRNKVRFLMTLIGIGGTTGLLIVGFGISHSIYSIVDKQFDEIIQYDGLVYYEDLSFDLNKFKEYTLVEVESIKVDNHEVSFYVAEDLNHLSKFITFSDRKSKETLDIVGDEVIISEKLAKLLSKGVGDNLDIVYSDQSITLTIDKITENYAGHYIYTSQYKLESLLDKKIDSNMVLFTLNNGDHDAINKELLLSEDVLAVQFLDEIAQTYQDMMKNFDIVIWVVVLSALALEVLVLSNLISMNMSERKKELATLKVLGFKKNELATYILRENIILTLLSIIFGFIFGKVLHYFVVTQAEIDMVMFNYELKLSSYLFSALLTLGLSIIINFIMANRANKVNMSEALKSFDQ